MTRSSPCFGKRPLNNVGVAGWRPCHRRAHSGAPLQFLLSCCLFIASFIFAQTPDYPVTVLKVPNPNDYTLFANSGWDGNWYVGYNTCWIKKLPPVPSGRYVRAYVGARLGRMKLSPAGKKPWEQQSLPGEIFMAISSTAAWTKNQYVRLTGTEDIPSEGDPESAIVTAGESQWFWAEVPLNQVNQAGENFLALWSPTPGFLSISSSPVLAAAWGGRDIDSWVDHAVKGEPSHGPGKALATGVSYFQPALALKLIPAGAAHPVKVRMVSWQNGTADHPFPIVTAAVEGDSIERAWVEFSVDQKKWTKIDRPLWKAPFTFSLNPTSLPKTRLALRVKAANIWEETDTSTPFLVDVSNNPETKH
ncbi:MAG: hypothetical protein WC859_06090 [Elusimicrobiota bacterium]